MVFEWPVKIPIEAYEEKLSPKETLITKIRILDTFFPVAKGGTYCVPGPLDTDEEGLYSIIPLCRLNYW